MFGVDRHISLDKLLLLHLEEGNSIQLGAWIKVCVLYMDMSRPYLTSTNSMISRHCMAQREYAVPGQPVAPIEAWLKALIKCCCWISKMKHSTEMQLMMDKQLSKSVGVDRWIGVGRGF